MFNTKKENSKMGETDRNYGWFWALMAKLPNADKDALVSQFTGGRTTHLPQMNDWEYHEMCSRLETVVGLDEKRQARQKALKKARSGVLHQMQLWGINTSDWESVDHFCENPRIAGKAFRYLRVEELKELNRKLRAMIKKKGGPRK